MKEKDFDNEYNYRVYLYGSEGYELAGITHSENDIYALRQTQGYEKMFVVRHDILQNMDEPFKLEMFPKGKKPYELGKRSK